MKPLLVFPSKFMRGVAGIKDGCAIDKAGNAAPVGQYWADGVAALRSGFFTDAHCAMYAIDGIKQAPRLTKRSLGALQTHKLSVMLHWVLVDVDNPQHKPWVCPECADISLFVALAERVIGDCGWYLTRCGYRLVWQLDPAIEVAKADSVLHNIVKRLRAVGIAADENCCDWTRLFRLPFVVRDKQKQFLPYNFDALC